MRSPPLDEVGASMTVDARDGDQEVSATTTWSHSQSAFAQPSPLMGEDLMFDKKTNIAAQEAFGEAVNTGDLDAIDGLVHPNSVDHDPAPGQQPGPEGYKQFFTELRTAFPDLHIEVENLVADDDNVAFAYTLTGTHQGPFQGHGATGKSVQVRGLQISKFAEGKMTERWGSTDEMGILTQLGLD